MSNKDDKNAPIRLFTAIFAAAAASMIVQSRGIDLAGPLGLPGALAVSLALFCYMAGFAIGASGITRALGPRAGGIMLLTATASQYYLFDRCFLTPVTALPQITFLPGLLNMACLTIAAIAAGRTLPSMLTVEQARKMTPIQALTIFNLGALLGLALSLPLVSGGMTSTYILAIMLSILHLICASINANEQGPVAPSPVVAEATALRPLSKQHRLAALAAGLAFILVESAVMRQAATSTGSNYASTTIMLALAIVALTIGSGAVAIASKTKNLLLLCLLPIALPALIGFDRLWYLVQMTIAALIFPLLLQARNQKNISQKDFASLYAASTLGSLFGPLLFIGFVKIGIISSWPAMAIVWAMVALCALVVLVSTANIQGTSRILAGLLLMIGLVNAVQQLQPRHSDNTVFLQDSYLAKIKVVKDQEQNLLTLSSNGKTEAAIPIDMSQPHPNSDIPTQRLLALLPYTLAIAIQGHQPHDTLIIGMGSGTTAMTAVDLKMPADLVELDDAVVRASACFYPKLTKDLIDSGKKIHLLDAAAYLSLLPESTKYEAIISQPSEPFINGSGPLYTKEFFDLAAGRLHANGIFAQWVQLYGLDKQSLVGLLATINDSFGHIMIFHPPNAGEIIVLASRDQNALSRSKLLQNLGGSDTALRIWASCGFFDKKSIDRSILLCDPILTLPNKDCRINTKDLPYLQYLVPPTDSQHLERQIQTNLQVLNKSKFSKNSEGLSEDPEKIDTSFLPQNLDVLKLRKSGRESLDKFLTSMHEKDLKLGNNNVEASLSIYPDDHETQLVAAMIELCGGQYDRAAQSIKNAHRLCRQSAANYSCAVLHAWFRRDRQTAYANLRPTAPEPVRQLLAETSWASRVDISTASRAIRAVLQQASDESTCNSI
jgi:Spermine/spermidine synthase domain